MLNAIFRVAAVQVALTLICAAITVFVVEPAAALGAVLGGSVIVASSVVFGLAFFWRSPRDRGDAGRALRTVLFAEAAKWMTAIGGLLWMLQARPFDIAAGPMVVGFIVALAGSWLALLTKT